MSDRDRDSESSPEENLHPEPIKKERSDSPTASHLSLKSFQSVSLPPDISDDAQRGIESKEERSDSPTASHLSVKSFQSVSLPPDISDDPQRDIERELSKEGSPKQAKPRPDPDVCQRHHKALSVFCETDKMNICEVCADQDHRDHRKHYHLGSTVPDSQSLLLHVMENMGAEIFKTLKTKLSEEYPGCLGNEPEKLSVSDAAEKILESFGGEGAWRVTFYIQENANPLQKVTEANKAILNKKCQLINEGNSPQGKQSSLKEIYTDLYMTDGGRGEINNEHEVLRNEMILQSRTTQEVQYACNDIFKTLPGQDTRVRTVLTMGIVGIGKHVSVQKFILDWADGKTNQDIEIIIHLPFRELNQRKESCSLLELIHQYTAKLKEADLPKLKMLFILDGLEVYRHPLDFHKNDHCADINKKVPVDVLLTNLIQGNLFPSALLWITTRPSTADRIPPELVHRVTEIRGFNDHQKESYFRKKISDQILASKIIAHIRSCRSLYIMCHMPIFCWISATVLEKVMSDGNSEETPRTLTEMFTHFLLIQISRKHKKFNGVEADNPKKLSQTDREMILKLGKMAFHKMQKGNLIFEEEDLINAGIDVSKVSEYALCTAIFREELGLYREKVYSFVHVSFQEYLAAIYAHFACVNEDRNVLDKSQKRVELSDLHQSVVDQALKSEKGHLDLFLRFILGLSVDYNCNLLNDLHTRGHSSESCADKNIIVIIQEKIKQEQSPERMINLIHCLNELNDNSLVEEIQTAMRSGTLLGSELEPEQWSALAYVLLTSGEELDEFDMKKFQTSTANQLRLLPVLRICKKARLDCCNLSLESCRIVASALQSVKSPLRELDLKNNKLDISGVNILLDGLKSPHCQVQKLGLAGCNFPSESCSNLASALKSTNSHLTELDLSYNQIQSGDGVKNLCNGLMSQSCTLQKLMLKRCGLTKASCVQLALVLKCNSHLKELELKSNDLQDSGVNQLSTGLEDPLCRLEKLGLSGCMVTEEGCRSLASALRSNAGHLEELDLSYNHPGDSGKKLLFDKKEDPDCKLKTLNFENGGECRIKEGLRKYACQLTVDPNTIHPRLELSDDNRKISETTVDQHYADNPDRFTLYPQAMCREALTDRSYFEVDCEGGVSVGVAYKTSDREENLMGVKNKFPSLLFQYGKLKLWQNNEITRVFHMSVQSKRVGVYVDWEHGSLSYYSILNGELNHLHTHHAKFKHELYTGFTFWTESSVTLCEMK